MIDKLHKATLGKTIVIAGLGGLGGYAAAELARSNISTLILADADSFELSNMDRQLFCSPSTMGKNKANVIAQELVKISSANIVPIEENLSFANGEVLKDADILLDCTDSVSSKLELEKLASYYGIPMVHAAIDNLYGQCTVIFQNDNILEKVYGTKERNTLPTLSFVPAMLASIQVAETLKTLAGITTLRHKLLVLDTLNNDLRILNLKV